MFNCKALYGFLMMLVFPVGLTVPYAVAGDCPTIEYGWTVALGGEGFDQARGVTLDRRGNVFTAGSYYDRVDFDPGKGKDTNRSKGEDDVYISSLGPNGESRWTHSIGGPYFDFAPAVVAIGEEYVALAGHFHRKVDFDPGRGKDVHRAVPDEQPDVFVTLFNSNGTYQWTRTFGGSSSDVAWGIAADTEGNIFITGWFHATADFDPGPGVDEHRSSGFNDVFVTKLGPDGSYRWTRTFGGPSFDVGWRVATDRDGNVIVVGEFRDRVDFDPTEGVDIRDSHGENDIFVVKLGPDGAYDWVYTVGGSLYDMSQDVAIDAEGNIYVTGSFTETVNFDPNGPGDIHISNGYYDFFLAKLGPGGSYGWTRTVGGPGFDAAFGVALDPNENPVVTGNFSLDVDFDPGPGEDVRTSGGARDVYVTAFTRDGQYRWTETLGGTDTETTFDLAVGLDGNIILVGEFASVDIDFDPTSGQDVRATNGSRDLFITKLYCGACEAVERHTVEGGKKKIISTVRALAPGGKVTVECAEVDPPGQPIRKTGPIDNDNAARLVFKRLRGGDYECRITEVKDASGDVICDAPTGRRRVTVK